MQWLIKIKVILFIYSMNVFPILCNCCILWAWYVHITLWKPNLKWITLGKNIEPFHHIYCSQILCTTFFVVCSDCWLNFHFLWSDVLFPALWTENVLSLWCGSSKYLNILHMEHTVLVLYCWSTIQEQHLSHISQVPHISNGFSFKAYAV